MIMLISFLLSVLGGIYNIVEGNSITGLFIIGTSYYVTFDAWRMKRWMETEQERLQQEWESILNDYED